ncbi:MAG: hypothetical protein ABIH48_02165 [Candidatus Falkowbacteria bacterium]
MNKTINLYLDKETINQAKKQVIRRGFNNASQYFTKLVKDMDRYNTKEAREILFSK